MFIKYLIRIVGVGLLLYSLLFLLRYIRHYDILSSYGKGELVGFSFLLILSIGLIILSFKLKKKQSD